MECQSYHGQNIDIPSKYKQFNSIPTNINNITIRRDLIRLL